MFRKDYQDIFFITSNSIVPEGHSSLKNGFKMFNFSSQNVTSETSDEDLAIVVSTSMRVICGILLSFIIVSGICGNSLVLFVIRGSSGLNDMLIRHLCVCDIMGCAVDMPLLAAQFVFFSTGRALIVVSNMNFTACVAFSLMNSIIINLMSICRKEAFKLFDVKLLTVQRLGVILPVSWVFVTSGSIAVGILSVFLGRRQWYLPSSSSYSLTSDIISIGSGYFSIFVVTITLVNLILSFIVSLRLIKEHNSMLQKTMIAARIDVEQKLTRAAFTINSMFIVCWLPWLYVRTFHLITGRANTDVAAFVTVFIGINHCINPFIYAGNVTETRVKMLGLIRRMFGWMLVCRTRSFTIHPEDSSSGVQNATTSTAVKISVKSI